ncbi:MAG: phage portal protein [Peptostreptococcaceae bacterium]|nr:phage portal protein [Peptostreptococcaceae bacterium]
MVVRKAWEWLARFVGEDKTVNVEICQRLESEVYFKRLAIQCCINLIADTLSLAEFQTFEKRKQTQKTNHYLLNVEPNRNYSASAFWRAVVRRLVVDNECLIIITKDGQLYPAESFTRERYPFRENVYRDIVVDGFKMDSSYTEPQVLYLQLNDERITEIVHGVYETYSALIAHSQKTYKRSNAQRGILEIPTRTSEKDADRQKQEELMMKRFKRFFEAENGAVMPLTNGYKYEDLTQKGYKTGSDSRDIRALVDDVFYFTALAFKIPPTLFLGQVQDTAQAMKLYLNLCINPLGDLIATEINRKMYGMALYNAGTYVKLDTSKINVTDIKDLAMAADILFRTGVHTINENRVMFGKEKSDDKAADEIFVTKNYMKLADAEKGGGSGG